MSEQGDGAMSGSESEFEQTLETLVRADLDRRADAVDPRPLFERVRRSMRSEGGDRTARRRVLRLPAARPFRRLAWAAAAAAAVVLAFVFGSQVSPVQAAPRRSSARRREPPDPRRPLLSRGGAPGLGTAARGLPDDDPGPAHPALDAWGPVLARIRPPPAALGVGPGRPRERLDGARVAPRDPVRTGRTSQLAQGELRRLESAAGHAAGRSPAGLRPAPRAAGPRPARHDGRHPRTPKSGQTPPELRAPDWRSMPRRRWSASWCWSGRGWASRSRRSRTR